MRYRLFSTIAAALMALPAAAGAQALDADDVCKQAVGRAQAYDRSHACGMDVGCLDTVRKTYIQAQRDCHQYAAARQVQTDVDTVCWRSYSRALSYDESHSCGMDAGCLDSVGESYKQAGRECHDYAEAAIARGRAQAEAAAYGFPMISREQTR